jgi:CheY-like chemotaxis protein
MPLAVDADPRQSPILLADENEDHSWTLGILLQGAGYDVVTAADGHDALQAARAHRPGVAPLDLGMPGLDGYAFAKRLRAEEPTSETLLVALTGYSDERTRRRCGEAGFDHHLVKRSALTCSWPSCRSAAPPPDRPSRGMVDRGPGTRSRARPVCLHAAGVPTSAVPCAVTSAPPSSTMWTVSGN